MALVEVMKKKFKLENKKRGYAISSINNPTVKIAIQILVGKVMQKFCVDEVLAPVITMAAQCMEGFQFNWVNYLCIEFLANYHEAQEQGKTFHYTWLLLSIVLVAWELPKDSQFPSSAPDLPKAVRYASLWATKDAHRIKERKIFCVLMEISIWMGINYKPRLSPIIYASLQSFVEFKADFNHVFIKVQKDPMKTWHNLPYLATDDVIFIVLESWPPEWRALAGSTMEKYKSIAQSKKEETKL